MNLDNLCMGCMSDKSDALVCPGCGWRESMAAESILHLPPRTILANKYILGRVLGQGGFGITYLAWDLDLNVKLAVKEYMPQALATRVNGLKEVSVYKHSLSDRFNYGLDKFLEEARTLAKFVDYPNIVSVRDFFLENGTAYLVMNYLEGWTLKEYRELNQHNLSAEQVLYLFMPLLNVLGEIHDRQILHRDISPDNLYVTNDNQLVLIDFGAARRAVVEASQDLSVIIKPGFTPEEQYRSKGNQGPWTDLYALAATMYWAMTGLKPPESLDRLAGETLIPPTELGVHLLPHTEKGIIKAMEVHAADRFQSASEFMDALYREYSQDEPFEASEEIVPLTWVEQKEIVNNNNNKVYILAGVALSVVVLAIATIFLWPNVDTGSTLSQEQDVVDVIPEEQITAEEEEPGEIDGSALANSGYGEDISRSDLVEPVEKVNTINVPADYRSIQEAINMASSGNTIVVAPGVYYENIDFSGKNIVLTSSNPEDIEIVKSTIINGRGKGSVVVFRNKENSSAAIIGFTITGGSGTRYEYKNITSYDGSKLSFTRNYGGGILVQNGSSPLIKGNLIIDNRADMLPGKILGNGGGIAVLDHSSPRIEKNWISSNRAGGFGGGIVVWYHSNPHILGNLIIHNDADDFGGGISVTMMSNPTISVNEIESNSSEKGGGIYIAHMSGPTVKDNLLKENSADYGAGIYIWRVNSTSVVNNKVEGNSSSADGAGVYLGNLSTVMLTGNDFEYNRSGGKGGAIWISADSSVKGSLPGTNRFTENFPDDSYLE